MNQTGVRHPGLESLLRYPLLQAIQERRTRRVASGISVLAGELNYHSPMFSHRLDALEEAVLIGSTGISGVVNARSRSAPETQRRSGRSRFDVHQRFGSCRAERRQLPGDVSIHGQRRRDLAY